MRPVLLVQLVPQTKLTIIMLQMQQLESGDKGSFNAKIVVWA